MKSNTWRETTLGELADFINGDRGKNYPGVADRVDVGIPFINTGHILPSGRLTQDDMDYITSEKYNQLGSGKVRPGDIVYCLRGSTIGKTARNHYEEGAIASSLVIVRAKPEVNQDYLYYFLTSPAGQQLAKSNDNGSAQPNLSAKTLSKYPLLVPSFEEQQSIVNTLNAIDNKIEVNTKLNQTLEEMAQAIFKSWFVDFDPVKAKMNGVQPEGMDAATVSLFPDKLVESELGLIPEGWDIATIKDFGSVVCGKTPSKKNADFYGGDVPFIKIPDTHGKVFITETTDTLTQAGDESQPKKRIPENSICVSCIATVGQVFITTKPSHTNQQINSVVPHDANSLYYLLFKFKGLNKHFHDLASGGSATLNMNTRTFSNIELVRPTADVMEAFHNTIGGLMQKMLTNQLENSTLAELRDTLLPKLLSGEIELGQAQELAEVE
ncbi:restriction endonuclease subunit S [Vibrio alginolyticus]|uniref:restriction endonuclease subunit S n=1 Tax=Vibrio alginolyticus TaxID=663 RepID=UPI001EEAF2B0|nr:restriction endonuclease subunit S [Vibrio alginolyticus]MCG6330611.1 restriction endonuclease subunit S [Vibrio alginolyticus]MCG6335072.1 restriction endonuclease subunit S [Vibrio alginolyticus]MCG6395050.1 restriction endonuclease subunit S [Vibrio alginolyticus]